MLWINEYNFRFIQISLLAIMQISGSIFSLHKYQYNTNLISVANSVLFKKKLAYFTFWIVYNYQYSVVNFSRKEDFSYIYKSYYKVEEILIVSDPNPRLNFKWITRIPAFDNFVVILIKKKTTTETFKWYNLFVIVSYFGEGFYFVIIRH